MDHTACLASRAQLSRTLRNETDCVRLAADIKLRPAAVTGGGIFLLNSLDSLPGSPSLGRSRLRPLQRQDDLGGCVAEHLSDLLDGEAGPNPPRLQDAPSAPSDDEGGGVCCASSGPECPRLCLLTLATFQGPGGRLWPSHALLAQRARCCVRTVERAMAQARDAGRLTWRAIRWRTPSGFWRRKSNLYALRMPAAAPTRQSGGEGEKRKIKKKL